MSHDPHDRAPGGGAERFDDEIEVRSIVEIAIALAVISVVSFAIGWAFYRGLSHFERLALDAKPSPLREANAPLRPPGPQLQVHPEGALAAFRAAEQARLNGWGWVGSDKRIAHVPVEKAIETVAAEGLPDFSAPAEAPPQ